MAAIRTEMQGSGEQVQLGKEHSAAQNKRAQVSMGYFIFLLLKKAYFKPTLLIKGLTLKRIMRNVCKRRIRVKDW